MFEKTKYCANADNNVGTDDDVQENLSIDSQHENESSVYSGNVSF